MLSEYECESVLTEKILSKYGSIHGIDRDLVVRIGQGTASEDDINTYIENAPKLVEKFKADMRQTEPDDYSDADVEIIVAMSARNHVTFQSRDEPFTKVITPNGAARALEGQPTLGGFAASHRYSEHLSPAQTISQFGLDYEQVNRDTKEIETPYLMDIGGQKVPQPVIYYMKTPMNDDIRANGRIPFDPRILQRVEAMANDPSRQGEDIQKMAQMVSRPEVCTVIARNNGANADDAIAAYKAQGFTVQEKALDAPYTGNTMPQYGKHLEGRSSYADLIQETSLTKSTAASEGTAIYVKVPRPGVTDPNLPGGSMEVKVAEWDGKKWNMIATKEQLDAAHAQALACVPEEARANLQKKFVTHEKLSEGFAKGAAKDDLAVSLPDAVKKKITEEETKSKRSLLTKITGDADVATAAVKFKGKKKKLSQNDDGDDDEDEKKRKAKKRKEQEEAEEQEQEEAKKAEQASDAA